MISPFGLTNVPSLFQRLMQKVQTGLNLENGPDFVVYIDDILVFSRTLEEHLEHLQLVIKRLEEAHLKFKPVKCQLICKKVKYLGHVLTPEGLKFKARLVEAVANFPQPQNVSDVRHFLGLVSYYRQFVSPGFKDCLTTMRHDLQGSLLCVDGGSPSSHETVEGEANQGTGTGISIL